MYVRDPGIIRPSIKLFLLLFILFISADIISNHK